MKTRKEINAMIVTLKKELDRLPDFDSFGDSNDESKKEIGELIDDLTTLMNGGTPVTEDVRLWIVGNPNSVLADYEG